MHLQLNFWIAWFVMVVLQAGVALPTPPGNLGVFHYITILALSIFGVSKEVGLSAGIVLHLMVYLPITLIGLYCFWHENLAWKTIINSVTRLFQPQ